VTGARVVEITTVDQMREALAIRRAVFTEEMGIPADVDVDSLDGDPAVTAGVRHVLAYAEGVAVATGRILLGSGPPEEAHIERIAVSSGQRGKGYGRAVMLELHEIARRLGYHGVVLGAEISAVGFYEGLGYTTREEPYLNFEIKHEMQDMYRHL
jgi:predicted GNAT family N-acyltransferase